MGRPDPVRLWRKSLFAGPEAANRDLRIAAVTVVTFVVAVGAASTVLSDHASLILFRGATGVALLASAGVCLWKAARNQGEERTWRALVGVMILGLTVPTAVVLAGILDGNRQMPRGGLSSLLFLVPTLLGLAGLLRYPAEPFDLAIRGRGPGRDRRWYAIVILDSMIVVGATTLLAWVIVLKGSIPIRGDPTRFIFNLSVTAVNLLLVVVVLLIATFRRPRSSFGLSLLCTGLVTFVLSTMVHLYAAVRGLSDVPRPLELGYLAGPLLIALAALVPPGEPASGGDLTAEGSGPRRRWWQAALPYLPLLAAGTLALARSSSADFIHHEEVWGLLILLLLAVARQLITMADNLRLLARVEDSQRLLRHQALHDPLTDLANRTLFSNRLSQALAARQHEARRLVLLFCDLDDFKSVNDTLGHAAGDDLLRVTARRLAGAVRPGDTVARFGGDEFAILLGAGSEDPAGIGRRLADAVRAPIRLADTTYLIATSVGLVIIEPSDPPISAEALLHRADLAMYAAKARGKGDTTIYTPELSAPYTDAALSASLAAAVRGDPAGGRLTVHYRPIVNLRTSTVVARDARLRWSHPQLGTVPAARLHPAGDAVGLAPALSRILVGHVCRDIARLPRPDQRVPVHVNIPDAQAAERSLAEEVVAALDAAGLPPTALVLQVTPTIPRIDPDAVTRVLAQLHDVGIPISITEVGGSEGLADALLLPIDIVMLKPAFIDRWVRPSIDRRITMLGDDLVRTIASLGIVVIADGVDDPGTALRLCDRGCALATGELFSESFRATEVLPVSRTPT